MSRDPLKQENSPPHSPTSQSRLLIPLLPMGSSGQILAEERIEIKNNHPYAPPMDLVNQYADAWERGVDLSPEIKESLAALPPEQALEIMYEANDLLIRQSNNSLEQLEQAAADRAREREGRSWFARACSSCGSLLHQKGLLFSAALFTGGMGLVTQYFFKWKANFHPEAFPTSSDINIINENLITKFNQVDSDTGVVWPTVYFIAFTTGITVFSALLYYLINACAVEPLKKSDAEKEIDIKGVQSQIRAKDTIIRCLARVQDLLKLELEHAKEDLEQESKFDQALFSRLQALKVNTNGLRESKTEIKHLASPSLPNSPSDLTQGHHTTLIADTMKNRYTGALIPTTSFSNPRVNMSTNSSTLTFK